jgi:hypothetical protein
MILKEASPPQVPTVRPRAVAVDTELVDGGARARIAELMRREGYSPPRSAGGTMVFVRI